MKKTKWIVSFGALAIFSYISLGNIFGFGVQAAYAAAVQSNITDTNYKDGVTLTASFDNHDQEVCTINKVEYQELSRVPGVEISKFHVHVGGKDIVIARVTGPGITLDKLKDFLHQNGEHNCTVVHIDHVFFLPIVPYIS